jgi:hypothetical protein
VYWDVTSQPNVGIAAAFVGLVNLGAAWITRLERYVGCGLESG